MKTTTTTITTKKQKETNMTNQPTPLTNIKKRNPKLRTALPVYNYNSLTTQQRKYYLNKYKNINITLINTKSYQQQNYEKALQEYKYNNMVQNPRPSTHNRLKQQAHEAVTRWNIHNNYTNKFIIFIDPTDYLSISDTRNTIKPKQHHDFIEKALKQLLRYKDLKLQIIDIQTGTTLRYTTTGLNTWEEINYTFNELISELYELNIQEVHNTTRRYTSTKAQDYIYCKQQHYLDLPIQPQYKQSHMINGTYINTVQLTTQDLTKQDIDCITYYEEHNLLERKTLTPEQVEELTNSKDRLIEAAKQEYELSIKNKENPKSPIGTPHKDLALKLFSEAESLDSKLLENEIKEEQLLSYEAISYSISEQAPSTIQPTGDLIQLDNPQPDYKEEYEAFYYNQQHKNQLNKSIRFYTK